MANVTDTLLLHKTATEDKEAKDAQANELALAKAEWQMLDQLMKYGWRLILEKLQHDEMEILVKLELAQDPTSMAKLVGSLLANRGQQVWPGRRMADLQQLIQDLEAQ